MNQTVLQRIILSISIGLFLASLTQEAYCTTNGCGGEWAGLVLVIFGWMGPMACFAGITWFANPLLISTWITINKPSNTSLYVSIISVIICLSFLFFDQVITGEDGHTEKIINYKLGYWLWLSSSVVMLFGNILMKTGILTKSHIGKNNPNSSN